MNPKQYNELKEKQDKELNKTFPMPDEWEPTINEPIYDLGIRRKDINKFLNKVRKESYEAGKEEEHKKIRRLTGKYIKIERELKEKLRKIRKETAECVIKMTIEQLKNYGITAPRIECLVLNRNDFKVILEKEILKRLK